MTPTPTPPQPSTPYALPIVALVLSVIGICLFPLAILGFVLGLVALLRINKEPQLANKAVAIVAMVLPAAALPITGILAAIAIPNFIRYTAKSKQLECRSSLMAAYTAQRAHFLDDEHFSVDAAELDLPDTRRYGTIHVGPSSWVEPAAPKAGVNPSIAQQQAALKRLNIEPGVSGECPECSFTVACVANVDNDDLLDVWSISSVDRTAPDGEPIPEGTAYNHQNDVTER